MSQVAGDISKITSGACKLTYKGVDLGHTSGGCLLSIKPIIRDRKVDEHGENTADVVCVGSTFTVKVKLAEKTLANLEVAYPFGGPHSADTWGIGRRPGSKATDLSGELVIHPLDGSGTLDDVTLHKVIVSDQGDVQVGNRNDDRTFDCTFKAILSEGDGSPQLLGTIGTQFVSESDDLFELVNGDSFLLINGDSFALIGA